MRHPDYLDLNRRLRRATPGAGGLLLDCPDLGVAFHAIPFRSRHAEVLVGQRWYRCERHDVAFEHAPMAGAAPDSDVAENLAFRFWMVRPTAGPDRAGEHAGPGRATVILHGLNERSWYKYLPWAVHLVRETRRPVILFPIAFHVSRVPDHWGHRLRDRARVRAAVSGNHHAHPWNAVISERMDHDPERFFWAGIQTFEDLVDLARDLREGSGPEGLRGAALDLVGYSAGGYLALSLLLGSPEGLFDASRAAIVASCGPLHRLRLTSTLIVDALADRRLMDCYVDRWADGCSPRMRHWREYHPCGRWLGSFAGTSLDRATLEPGLARVSERVLAVAGDADSVMPREAMAEVFAPDGACPAARMLTLSLGAHENPFAAIAGAARERDLVSRCLDEERFGAQFERFIGSVATHLLAAGPPEIPASDGAGGTPAG